MAYIDILLVALVTIYIVEVSGFTQSWRSALAHLLGVRPEALKPIKPFDCGQCMTWWVGNICAIILHNWTIGMVAYVALLALLSYPISQFMIFIREGMNSLIGKMIDKL